MHILGIETSCDETAAAVVDDGRIVRSNVIASSQQAFGALAGVIPEQAARMMIECVLPVISQALTEATTTPDQIDAIAVTRGPGLLGSLLVGTTTARVLASVWKKPLIGVHHTFGHLSSTWLSDDAVPDEPTFPLLTLSVSGGHTDLWYRTSHLHGTLLGRTRDDAAGEAFDKGASMLGLPYPGGPHLSTLAQGGDPHAHDFPLPLKKEAALDFSFSGLKTSLRYLLRDLGEAARKEDVAAAYEFAICRHLLDRVQLALQHHPDVRELHIVGGVSANRRLRAMAADLCQSAGRPFVLRTPASLGYCTDNAAMIAAAGHFLRQEQGNSAFDAFDTEASISLLSVVSPLNS